MFCFISFIYFICAENYCSVLNNYTYAITCRSSLDTKCKESSKCSTGRDCESKAQTIFSDEQAQKKSSKGNDRDLLDIKRYQIFTSYCYVKVKIILCT